MNEEFRQTPKVAKKFRLGPLGSLNQVTKGLAKTIRAMADGTLDSQGVAKFSCDRVRGPNGRLSKRPRGGGHEPT